MLKRFPLLAAVLAGLTGSLALAEPQVRIDTSLGPITVELNAEQAPNTVANFLAYAKSGFYNGTLFHRVIDGFMIQGGGFSSDFQEKPTQAPIRNEADNGLKNRRGSIAMARTSDPHSATAQFFINLKDNDFLDFRAANSQGWGYCVFGRVTEGMDVVETIAKVATTSRRGHQDVPADDVVIERAEVID